MSSFQNEILERVPFAKKAPTVHYSPRGDCVKIVLVDEDYFGRRFDDFLTVYYSHKTQKPIGFLFKGIKELIQTNLGARLASEGGKKMRPATLVSVHAATVTGNPQELHDAYNVAEKVDAEMAVCGH